MSGQVIRSEALPPLTPADAQKMGGIVSCLLETPEVGIPLDDFFHAGTYVRTCLVPKGAAIVGALIKIPTVVIVSGKCEVTAGSSVRVVDGYAVLRAAPMRRQAFFAVEDTYVTMSFASNAKTRAEAEKEFTDEWELLTTNLEGGLRGKV